MKECNKCGGEWLILQNKYSKMAKIASGLNEQLRKMW